MRRAAELWDEGEKALAHIHLAHANLPPCGEDATRRLFLAEECFSEGITPAELMKAQGYVSALLALLKYNPDQPRVPPGSGRESGEWTSGGDSAAVAAPPATAVPASLPSAAAAGEGAGTLAADLFEGASPRFLAGLAELGATICGAGAVLGAIFVPSPNPGLTSEGAVPGDPNLRYTINHDEATLRLTRDGKVVVAAQRGQGGIFYDDTGTPIARDVDGSIVFDAATLESVAAPKETSRTSDGVADAATQAKAEDETPPNVCPEPGPDRPHGDKERARLCQAQISKLINPQRPLPPGLAVTLNGVVFDECRESDGTMIEAQGAGLSLVLVNDNAIVAQGAGAKLVDQATQQVQASDGRNIEWYFAEAVAADKAREIFDKDSELRRIFIFTVPAEAP